MICYSKHKVLLVKGLTKYLLSSGSVLIVLCLLNIGCAKTTFSSETDLLKYIKVPENGYTQSKTINGILYQLTLRPTDMLVKQELGNKKTTDSIVKVIREKYHKYLYFNLSMSQNKQELLNAKAGNRNEFGAMVNQLAFGMNEKVHLYTQSKDTLALADFIYPRMYGMSNATTLMFVYPRDKKITQETLNFTIEDLGFYTGEVKFKLDPTKFHNEPQLSFKN